MNSLDASPESQQRKSTLEDEMAALNGFKQYQNKKETKEGMFYALHNATRKQVT